MYFTLHECHVLCLSVLQLSFVYVENAENAVLFHYFNLISDQQWSHDGLAETAIGRQLPEGEGCMHTAV